MFACCNASHITDTVRAEHAGHTGVGICLCWSGVAIAAVCGAGQSESLLCTYCQIEVLASRLEHLLCNHAIPSGACLFVLPVAALPRLPTMLAGGAPLCLPRLVSVKDGNKCIAAPATKVGKGARQPLTTHSSKKLPALSFIASVPAEVTHSTDSGNAMLSISGVKQIAYSG